MNSAGELPERESIFAPATVRRTVRSAYIAQAGGEILRLAFFRGGVLPLYAIQIGANNIHLGLLSGMPEGLMVFMYAVSPLIERYGKRRWLVTFLTLASIASLGIFLVQPFYVAAGEGVAVATLLAVMFLHNALVGLGFSGWWPLINDIIPKGMIGVFFGRMRTLFELSALTMVLGASAFLGAEPAIKFCWWGARWRCCRRSS